MDDKMRVVFTFDEDAMKKAGYEEADVRYTIRSAFEEYGFPCVSDGAELAFEDLGREDDYADMWNVILNLLKSKWFLASAASCVWYDEEGEEDVLSQAWKVRDL